MAIPFSSVQVVDPQASPHAAGSSPFDLRAKLLWPTTCFLRAWERHAQEAPQLIQHLYELQACQKTAIASGVAVGAKSRRGLYESTFDLLESPHPSLVALRAFIVDTVQQAVCRVNQAQVEPQRIVVEIVDSWFHITNHGGFHDAHFHGGCSWCGIYYVQVGDAGPGGGLGAPNGGSRFYSPLVRGGSYGDYGNRYLDQAYCVDAPVRDGLLLLFPSYLWHSGLPYAGTLDRIVIAFNTRSFLS